MALKVVTTSPPARLEALEHAVAAAQSSDPLAPVTVVVPTNASGVMARRALGRRGGVVGVDMVTLNRVAELVAGPSLAASQRVPSSAPVIDLAVSHVLAEEPGMFASVRDHPSTVVALRDAHRELRSADPDAVERLGTHSRRGEAVARVSTAVRSALAERWYDEGDLFDSATSSSGSLPTGACVVYLPSDLSGRRRALLEQLGRHGDVTVILETPRGQVDPAVAEALAAIDASPSAGQPSTQSGQSLAQSGQPERIITSTDADDEVRHAVRVIVDAARDGVPFDRMAIVWPSAVPYARLVEHHLSAAGVAWNGTSGTHIAERRIPRLVLDLLDLDRRGLDRPLLFDLLCDVPPRDSDGQLLPAARWERVSRAAGVVRAPDWRRRLPALHASERWGPDAQALSAFVEELRDSLGPRHERRPWSEWVDWCDTVVHDWLGNTGLNRLDDEEFRAWEALGKASERLRYLDEIDGPVTRPRFAAMLAAEVDNVPARRGRTGHGVFVGSLAGATGLELDAVVVLGGSEGSLPPSPHTDPLLSDGDRAAAGLVTSSRHAQLLEHRLHTVVESSSVTVTAPRGDLRAAAERPLSRWLLPWSDLVEPVASNVAGIARTVFPTSSGEHRLRELLHAVATGDSVGDAPTAEHDQVIQRGLVLRSARRSSVLTEFDGDLSGAALPPLARAESAELANSTTPGRRGDGVLSVSPTHLERWAACPHAFFSQYLLGVTPLEEPSSLLTISPADRGNALHDTLEHLHRAVIDGRLPQPTDGWTDEHGRFAFEVFDDVASRADRRGRTGRAAFWHNERERMRSELAEWLVSDGAWLAERRAEVVAAEVDLGRDEQHAIDLGDGRQLALRGRIDRVTTTAEGRVVVTDFKTGGDRHFKRISDDDPTLGHTHFQLAAYALARRTDPDESVEAEYAMMRKGRFRRYGFTLGPATESMVSASFAYVVDGIEAGLFPSRPARPGFQLFVECAFCDPDGLGTEERWDEWERKRTDERLAPRWGALDDDSAARGDA